MTDEKTEQNFKNKGAYSIVTSVLEKGYFRIYEGEFIDNLEEGIGIEKTYNGQVYSGNWVNGQKNGTGKLVDSNGEETKGEFINGKLLRKHNSFQKFVAF